MSSRKLKIGQKKNLARGGGGPISYGVHNTNWKLQDAEWISELKLCGTNKNQSTVLKNCIAKWPTRRHQNRVRQADYLLHPHHFLQSCQLDRHMGSF